MNENDHVISEWQQIFAEGTEEEKQILALAVQAVKQKRERKSAYLSGFMALKGEFVDANTYQFQVPITPFMHNSLGILHGGITATLLDSTMGSLVNKTLPDSQYAVTTDLTIHYLKPGTKGQVRTEGTIINKGKTLVLCEAKLFDDRDRLLAHATGTFMILRK